MTTTTNEGAAPGTNFRFQVVPRRSAQAKVKFSRVLLRMKTTRIVAFVTCGLILSFALRNSVVLLMIDSLTPEVLLASRCDKVMFLFFVLPVTKIMLLLIE